MTYNFDEVLPQQGTYSVKWEYIWEGDTPVYGDHADPKHGDEQILPMWVADMDFQTAPPIVQALQERAAHGIFGYTKPGTAYMEAVADWTKRRYGWEIEPDWIIPAPGVVATLHLLVKALVKPGEKVLIQRPVYFPFTAAVEHNGAVVVTNSLVYEDGRYHMDFDDLAQKVADPDLKLAILCSPHNPVGRVWTKEELTRFGEICLANDVLVISDEIHCDLIHSGHTFTSFAGISEEFAQNSVICIAASKTFNLAGLKTSSTIIANDDLRQLFSETLMNSGIFGVNGLGLVATEAAYRHGEDWLTAVLAYIEANYKYMADYLAECVPQIKPAPLEGTYLCWLDCSELGLTSEELKTFFRDEVRLLLNSGDVFGEEGTGFMRINLACHRPILVKAMERLRTAVAHLTTTN
jgi:cystathionine beta-lyase